MTGRKAVRTKESPRTSKNQTQLSRSLQAGRTDVRTQCVSAEDSSSSGSRKPQAAVAAADDDDVDEVFRLPDTVDTQSTDFFERLSNKRQRKHEDALEQMHKELRVLAEACESQLRTATVETLSCLQQVDLRLDNLKATMEQMDGLADVSQQEVCALWDEVEKEVKSRRSSIEELNRKLMDTETWRSVRLKVILKKSCDLLEKISFLPPADIHRLIHNQATNINLSLLANRRTVAAMKLRLLEENLEKESELRVEWEEFLNRWRTSTVTPILDNFRCVDSRDITGTAGR